MKLSIGILTMFLVFAEFGEAQTKGSSSNTEILASVPEAATENYAVFDSF